MKEWGLTPGWINENWDEEMFALMLKKAADRYEAQNEASQGDFVGDQGFSGADEFQAVRAARKKGAAVVDLSSVAATLNGNT